MKVNILKNVQIEESPGQTTAGLTSASQLVNITDAISFDYANTSSAVPDVIINSEPSLPVPECNPTPIDNFKTALRSSMRHQGKILDILAKL
jgi:hypothetical protein